MSEAAGCRCCTKSTSECPGAVGGSIVPYDIFCLRRYIGDCRVECNNRCRSKEEQNPTETRPADPLVGRVRPGAVSSPAYISWTCSSHQTPSIGTCCKRRSAQTFKIVMRDLRSRMVSRWMIDEEKRHSVPVKYIQEDTPSRTSYIRERVQPKTCRLHQPSSCSRYPTP